MPSTPPAAAPTAHVVTVSDRVSRGDAVDTSGPAAVAALKAAGYTTTASVVADGIDTVSAELRRVLDRGTRFIVTTGGTGVAPRDQTPEATQIVLERVLPGVPEMLRAAASATFPHAVLTRGVAGVTGRALLVNLPGSPAAVSESLALLLPLAPHILDQLDGGDH